MAGEVAGSQPCTGICESWGKKFAADGLQAQTCLPVDRILVKDSDVRRRPGPMHGSDMELGKNKQPPA